MLCTHCENESLGRTQMKIDMHFHEKRKLGRKTRLWGDTSAFSLMTRIPILDEILETFPPEWLVRTRNVREEKKR